MGSGPARAIVFNADDFGLTAGVNAGIIGAHRAGLVRSASLMTTTPGFADAVALARAHSSLDLGVHLALTSVWPALSPGRIPSLVGATGRFPPLAVWLRWLLAGRLRPAELRAELTAQLDRAVATRLSFSHLDGHHHGHLFAPVTAIVTDLARIYRIPVVRRVRVVGREPLGGVASVKRQLIAAASAGSDSLFDGLLASDAFRGFAFPRRLDRWRALVATLPTGLTEFMCHPGLADPAVREFDPYREARQTELRWLRDPRVAALLHDADVRVISWADYVAERHPAPDADQRLGCNRAGCSG